MKVKHIWHNEWQEPTQPAVIPSHSTTQAAAPAPLTYIQHQVCGCGARRRVLMPSGRVIDEGAGHEH